MLTKIHNKSYSHIWIDANFRVLQLKIRIIKNICKRTDNYIIVTFYLEYYQVIIYNFATRKV
jgi:hypothetical protein